MSWVDPILDELARSPGVGYSPQGTTAAEPTALAASAFAAHGRPAAALAAADQLVVLQQANGEVGVRSGENTPGWPTSLAIVAWQAVGRVGGRTFVANTERALAWLLTHRGESIERSDLFGHNTELVGWAYAEGTHSWVEPTAFAVLALKAAGREQAPATREGVSVLIDRQLPDGGLNYGNTVVLGQLIRPHIQPTGIALLALAGEKDASGRLEKSIAWLQRNIGPDTTPLSLGWAILGLTAQRNNVSQAEDWLASAAARVNNRDRSSHKLALLALAAKGWPQ